MEEISNGAEQQEVLVNVRGKTKYAILSIEYYNRLRELELEMALNESIEDIKSGKYTKETADEHLKRISK